MSFLVTLRLFYNVDPISTPFDIQPTSSEDDSLPPQTNTQTVALYLLVMGCDDWREVMRILLTVEYDSGASPYHTGVKALRRQGQWRRESGGDIGYAPLDTEKPHEEIRRQLGRL
jgi:hypothetical protein